MPDYQTGKPLGHMPDYQTGKPLGHMPDYQTGQPLGKMPEHQGQAGFYISESSSDAVTATNILICVEGAQDNLGSVMTGLKLESKNDNDGKESISPKPAAKEQQTGEEAA